MPTHPRIIPSPPPPQQNPTFTVIHQRVRTHSLYDAYILANSTIFTSQTSRFFHKSTAWKIYRLVLYDFNSNHIHVEAISSRSSYQILRTLKLLITRGLRPKLHRLNNKCLQALIPHYLGNKWVAFHFTPPYIHYHNVVERTICTLKIHFIICICNIDPTFNLEL